MDRRLRSAHREASQGDARASARLLVERLRSGDLDEERLHLAAYLGDRTAQAVAETAPEETGFAIWLHGLERWGHPASTRAGVALLRRALEERSSLPDRPHPAVLRALKEAEGFCEDPDRASRGWWVLQEAQAAALVRSGIDQEIGWLACEVLQVASGDVPGLQDVGIVALRILSEDGAREAVAAALLPWALGETDPHVAR